MKYLFTFVVTSFLAFSGTAHAITPVDILSGSRFDTLENNVFRGLEFAGVLDYQIGEEWGKKPVTEADMTSNAAFARMAKATARVRSGGTGFYLGEFNGEYVMATNHHVCPSASACSGASAVQFPLMAITTSVVKFFGTWPEVDLAVFTIRLTPAQAQALAAVASPFAFTQNLYRGQKLTTIGFGVAANPRGQLMANRDADCVVFSGDGEYRLMADPDDFNPGPYKAWSFANGCDVSHGDSGSAMMDRDTGHVVGIIWTGRIPKNEKVRSSTYLQGILASASEDIWKELSYGVPAVRMKTYLDAEIARGAFAPDVTATLRAMLQ